MNNMVPMIATTMMNLFPPAKEKENIEYLARKTCVHRLASGLIAPWRAYGGLESNRATPCRALLFYGHPWVRAKF
jgi:hypothetical protein